ncbi:hypothetical protein B0H14DRAFT_2594599 [Mycena olivaceomarginata]|nr:hypothetical protein B0H14DRAFT_2640528 [Mycena olivaceomarginata]KAJ7828592.1 hypothetical protein B0H14DRAFT_2594599 [Mycena olivaceomarginata]
MSGGHNAPRAPRVRKAPNLIPTTVSDSSGPGLSPSRAGPPWLGLGPQEMEAQALPGRAQAPAFRLSRDLQNTTQNTLDFESEEYRKFEQSKKVDDVYLPPMCTCSQNKQDQDPEGAGEAWGFELEIEERLTPCPELRTLRAA